MTQYLTLLATGSHYAEATFWLVLILFILSSLLGLLRYTQQKKRIQKLIASVWLANLDMRWQASSNYKPNCMDTEEYFLEYERLIKKAKKI